MTAAFAFAYVAGVLAAFNPCGFAMLPGWVGYFLATGERHESDMLARLLGALWVGTVMSLGFIFMFGLVAMLAVGGSVILNRVLPLVDLALAAGLAALGAYLLTGATPPGLSLPRPTGTPRRSARGMFVYGLGYGIATLSCVMPVFLVALGVSTSGGPSARAAGFIGFSLGIMSVILLVTILASLTKGAAERLRVASRYVSVLSGALLIGAAAYIAWREIPLAAITIGLQEPPPRIVATVTATIILAGSMVGLIAAKLAGQRAATSH